MNVNARASSIRVWPHLTLVFVAFAAVGAVAAALWMRHESKSETFDAPSAARVERVDGEVGLSRDLKLNAGADADWVELTPNTPLTVGDRLYARADSRAAIAFTGRNFATVDPDSALDVVSLSDRRTQLALREGSAVFDIGALQPGELFEVATPYGAVDLREPGLYQVGYRDDGSAFVSVLNGVAQVVGLAGSGEVGKGEMLTLLGQTAAQVALSRLNPDDAGGLLDDYYGYRYPDQYDGRYADYNAYLNDPYYYDPAQRDTSYRYVPATVPGASDLDAYGDWQNLNDYGYAWSPRVEQDWAPYRDGYWMMDDPYGLTWVSNEPWGYAPYHYGRWVSVAERWYWVPDGAKTQPAYSPALVAFLPGTGANQVGWVPLAPSDPYVPAYYDSNWQPHYAGNYSAPERVVNMSVPGGVTVVSVEDFGRRIDRRSVERFDPRAFEHTRPLLDPLSNAMLRQASLKRAVERRGFALPPGLAKKLEERQVYASAPPRFRGDRGDLARRFRVDAVPEKQRREKLKFADRRQEPAAASAPARAPEEFRGRWRDSKREDKSGQRVMRGREAWGRPATPEAERVGAEAFPRGERPAQANPERQQRFEARRQADEQQRAQQAAQRAQQQQERQAGQQQRQEARQAQQEQRRTERQQRQQVQRPERPQASPGQGRKQEGRGEHGGGRRGRP